MSTLILVGYLSIYKDIAAIQTSKLKRHLFKSCAIVKHCLTQFHCKNAFNEYMHQLRATGIPNSLLPTMNISIHAAESNDVINVPLAQLPSAERFLLQRNFGLVNNQDERNPLISESDDELTVVAEVT